MRTIVIGDIHGCNTELVQLLRQLQLTDQDHIILLGDLLDKGPEPIQVLETVYQLSRFHRVDLVLGNHEFKYLKAMKQLARNQTPTTPAWPKLRPVIEQMTSNHIKLLNSSVLYVPFQVGNNHYLCVHGGIAPHHHSLPDVELADILKGRKAITDVLFCRYVRDGLMIPLGQEHKNDRFWADLYQGRFGHVFFGHQPFEQIKEFDHATGIDTGCCYGGSLTAAVVEQLDNGLIIETFHQVPALAKYARTYGEDNE